MKKSAIAIVTAIVILGLLIAVPLVVLFQIII